MAVGVRDMPRKAGQGKGEPAPKRKQYNVGFPIADAGRIDACADALGLDEANFLRMVVRENLPKYEERARAIRQGEQLAKDPNEKPPG